MTVCNPLEAETQGVPAFTHKFFHKPPPGAHQQDWDQSRRSKRASLVVHRHKTCPFSAPFCETKALHRGRGLGNHIASSSLGEGWQQKLSATKGGVRVWRETPTVAQLCRVDHESGVWTLGKLCGTPSRRPRGSNSLLLEVFEVTATAKLKPTSTTDYIHSTLYTNALTEEVGQFPGVNIYRSLHHSFTQGLSFNGKVGDTQKG